MYTLLSIDMFGIFRNKDNFFANCAYQFTDFYYYHYQNIYKAEKYELHIILLSNFIIFSSLTKSHELNL